MCFALLLTGFVFSAIAGPPAAEPPGTTTPCAWLQDWRQSGASLPELVRLAAAQSTLFTAADLRCLKKARFHDSVIQAARGGSPIPAAQVATDLASPPLTGRFDLRLLGVTVSPAEPGGRAWDGTEQVRPSLLRELLALLPSAASEPAALDPVSAQLFLSAPAGSPAPDVFGTLTVIGPGAPSEWDGLALALYSARSPARDSYQCTFPDQPGFSGLSFDGGDRLRISLFDQDFSSAETIAVFDLDATDLAALSARPGPAILPVADRTGGRVLAVSMSVRASTESVARLHGLASARP